MSGTLRRLPPTGPPRLAWWRELERRIREDTFAAAERLRDEGWPEGDIDGALQGFATYAGALASGAVESARLDLLLESS